MVTANNGAAKHILSFGGGVNTAALMVLLVRSKRPVDEVVFADTGGEAPETYQYLEVAESYLKDHGILFRVLKARVAGGDLYDACWRRRVIPSVVWRWSTRDFKVNPIYAYYRSLGVHVYQHLGIAYDEVDRMKDSGVPYVTNLYPLIDEKLTRDGCIQLVQEAGLPVPVKSGCFFCPFNSTGRWAWIYQNHPDLYWKAVALEENSKHFPKQRLTDQMFRERATVTLREFTQRLEDEAPLPMADVGSPCGGWCMT